MSTSLAGYERENALVLGTLATLRGRDNAGVITARKHKGQIWVDHRKGCGNFVDFWTTPSIEKFIKDTDPFLIAGHARFATIGDITIENAHPFKYKHIFGMHNGTTPYFEPDKKDLDKYSDSRLLFENLADKGLNNTLEKANLNSGAYVLIWVDIDKSTLNFVRNDKRPLYFLETSGNTIYWHSERESLDYMMAKCKLPKYKTVEYVFCDVHYSFELGNPNKRKQFDLKKKTEAILIKPVFPHSSEASVPTINPQRKHDANKVRDEMQNAFTYLDGANIPDSEEKDFIEEYFKERVYQGFNEELLSREEAVNLLSKGCSGCNDPLDIRDEAFWFSNKDFLCKECMNQSWHKQYSSHRHHCKGILLKKAH